MMKVCDEDPHSLYLFKRKDGQAMVNRTRPIIMKVAVNESEQRMIQKKMEVIGTKNFGAYARKMLIDGYIIKVDYTEAKRLAAAVSRAASNINQVCKRLNSTGRFYQADIQELKERQEEIWRLLKLSQSKEM